MAIANNTTTTTTEHELDTKEEEEEKANGEKQIIEKTFSHLLLKNYKEDQQLQQQQLLGKRELRFVVPDSDTVREITNILTKDECNAIIDATSSCTDGSGGFSQPTAFSKEHRDCNRIHTVDKAMSDLMMPRLCPYLPEIVTIDGARWRLSRFTHHWRYVRYYPGGHFSPHYDGAKMTMEPKPCISVFTVQIYLNAGEDFTGGSTRFYPDYKPNCMESHEIKYGHVSKFDPFTTNYRRFEVAPETGKALVFNHVFNTLHDGAPVLTGKKFIMRGDILYTVLPEDQHLLPPVTQSVNSDRQNLQQRLWCPFTASKHGTRNHVGEVWYCACANDKHGATLEGGGGKCWHRNDDDNIVGEKLELVKDIDEKSLSLKSNNDEQPKVLVLISGKRGVGKDYISDLLRSIMVEDEGLRVHRTALGNMNKRLYAESAGIDLDRLMSDRAFKESHRIAMVAHHTEMNKRDPEWCVKAVLKSAQGHDIMILSDLRTYEDLKWFKSQKIPIVVLRISASDAVRSKRGWDPCPIKDTLNTEVSLDEYVGWTACWDNSLDTETGNELLKVWLKHTVIPRVKKLLQEI